MASSSGVALKPRRNGFRRCPSFGGWRRSSPAPRRRPHRLPPASGAYDDLGRKFLADIAWVGTDAGFRMCLLDRGQWRADLAFAVRASDGERKHRRAGSKRRQHIVDHRLEDLRHAGHDMDIADDEAWRCRDWIGDVHSARGMRAIRWRASVNSISRRRYISASSVIAVSSYSQGTPKALEMASAVMSSCVGPMPPEVKT